MPKNKSEEDYQREIEKLKERVQIAEDTLEAIRTGSIDAIAVTGENGTEIYTLKSADKTYRNLVEKMNESGLTLNSDGVILYCNSQFSRLVNLPLSKVIGSSFSRFLPIESHSKFYDLFRKGWKETSKGEFSIQSSTGEYIYVQMSLNTIEAEENIVLGIIITDISELKKAYTDLQNIQNELKQLNATLEAKVLRRTEDLLNAKKQLQLINLELSNKNEELLRTNNDLDNFVYTASHDLKAPISNIEGLLFTLNSIFKEKNIQDKDIDEIMSMMNHSINRFKGTIIDLSEIVKIQKNNYDDIAPINCREIVKDVKETIQLLIQNSEAAIHIDIDDRFEINFSRKNLHSIVYNLLSNAIKYRSPNRKPEIFLKAESAGDYTIMTVKDNGLGMKREDKDKIFSMFKRLHDHVEGTGVGLYIVKRIIDNAGGKIEVDSILDEGTVFKVYFKNIKKLKTIKDSGENHY
jgi:PAS domain S-box-containing protein